MKILQVSKKEIDKKKLIRREALNQDAHTVVDSPTIIKDWDNVIAILDMLPSDNKKLVKALKRIKFPTTKRTWWLLSTSRIFGYKPRNPIRNNFCSKTSLVKDYPEENEIVISYAKQLNDLYKKYLPDWYKHHEEQLDWVLDEWKMSESVFTSWIINKNNPLKYHHDTGNFDNVFSNMITIKQNIEWGHLVIPEYDIIVKLPSNSVFMFDGQKILHWVSPIKKLNKSAYRFTIVFYSLKKMWDCIEPEGELKRIKDHQTDLYKKRVKIMKEKWDDSVSFGDDDISENEESLGKLNTA